MQMTYCTTILVMVIWVIRIVIFGGLIYLAVLAVKGLRKYLNSTEVRKEKNSVKKSLGEALKEHRTRCKMIDICKNGTYDERYAYEHQNHVL